MPSRSHEMLSPPTQGLPDVYSANYLGIVKRAHVQGMENPPNGGEPGSFIKGNKETELTLR
jgi:hypothetical protein